MQSPNPRFPSTNTTLLKQRVSWLVMLSLLAAILLNIMAILTMQNLFIAISACIISGLGLIFTFLQAFPSTISHLQQSWRFGIKLLAALLFLTSIGLNMFSFAMHRPQTVQSASSPALLSSPSLPLTPLSSSTVSIRLALLQNIDIPCRSFSDGRSPAKAGCSPDFPLTVTLNQIDLNQRPTAWHLTLWVQPSGLEAYCSTIQFTNIQLTDAAGNIYPVKGAEGPWTLTTGQSQSVLLTFDIHPQPGSLLLFNITIQTCHHLTAYQTLSLST